MKGVGWGKASLVIAEGYTMEGRVTFAVVCATRMY